MSQVLLTIKIMPESPLTNLNEIKDQAEKTLSIEGAKNISFEEKPIAFGLKAIIMRLALPEEKGSEIVENKISAINDVSSVTIEDYRRAFG